MFKRTQSRFHPVLCCVGIAACFSNLRAQITSQNINLSVGWNAIWLEVEPVYQLGDVIENDPTTSADDETVGAGHPRLGETKDTQDVFSDPNIEVITSPKPGAGLAEVFAGAPTTTTNSPNPSEWTQWSANDIGSNTLLSIRGNRPYLVKINTSNVNLSLKGKVKFFRPTWKPDRYNLIGFGIKGSITFEEFFASKTNTHLTKPIYSLATTGTWEQVTSNTANLEDRKAYWIFSNGPSNYMGPVAIDFNFSSLGTLDFGSPDQTKPATEKDGSEIELDTQELTLTNRSSAIKAIPRIQLIAKDAGPGSLHLYVVNPNHTLGGPHVIETEVIPSSGQLIQDTISPGESAIVTLGAKRNWRSGEVERVNLYRLTASNPGLQVWLPIAASNTSISPTAVTDAAPIATGLWTGDAIIDGVTSLVEDGQPIRKSAGTTPIRIIIHCNSSGRSRLLNQVTIMQTKTADPTITPSPILLLNPAKAHHFEGINERQGKKVGLRLQTISYDMPRNTTKSAQADPENPNSDLIQSIISESQRSDTRWASGQGLYNTRSDVTAAAIDSFLLFRTERPPSLKEKYEPYLDLAGDLGMGNSVSGTLTLDPFHRTHPFRHSYHQRHARGGQKIERDIKIVFDSKQAFPDRLRGSYTETIKGLTKTNLQLTGRIELKKISNVTSLVE